MPGIICLLVFFQPSWVLAWACQHLGKCRNVGTYSQRRRDSFSSKVLLSMEMKSLQPGTSNAQGRYRKRSIKDGHSAHAGFGKTAGIGASSRPAKTEMAEIRSARIDRAARNCDFRHDLMGLERLGGWA